MHTLICFKRKKQGQLPRKEHKLTSNCSNKCENSKFFFYLESDGSWLLPLFAQIKCILDNSSNRKTSLLFETAIRRKFLKSENSRHLCPMSDTIFFLEKMDDPFQ